MHDIRFPGEPEDYRAARDELLRAEIELRRQIESVAAQREGRSRIATGSCWFTRGAVRC
jgi:predicted dithiol-disulfide oxidoreductase (DUF899 family)